MTDNVDTVRYFVHYRRHIIFFFMLQRIDDWNWMSMLRWFAANQYSNWNSETNSQLWHATHINLMFAKRTSEWNKNTFQLPLKSWMWWSFSHLSMAFHSTHNKIYFHIVALFVSFWTRNVSSSICIVLLLSNEKSIWWHLDTDRMLVELYCAFPKHMSKMKKRKTLNVILSNKFKSKCH